MLAISWESLPEGEICCVKPSVYAIRISTVVDCHREICLYKDKNIVLLQIMTSSDLVFGYVINVLNSKLLVLNRKWWLSLLSNVAQHTSPVVLFENTQSYLYRFNGNRNPSYWFILRINNS